MKEFIEAALIVQCVILMALYIQYAMVLVKISDIEEYKELYKITNRKSMAIFVCACISGYIVYLI
jgi:hypothetical protein